MGGMSIGHWLIVLAIVLLVFGSRKLGNVGSDLGKAIRDFKKSLSGDEDEDENKKPEPQLKVDKVEPQTSQRRDEQMRERDD